VPVPLKPGDDGWVAEFGGLLASELGSGAPVLLCCAEVGGKGVCRRPVVRTSRGRPLACAEQSGFVLVEALAHGEACATESAGDDCGGAEDVGGAAATEEFSPDLGAAADDGSSAGVRVEARWKSAVGAELGGNVVFSGTGFSLSSCVHGVRLRRGCVFRALLVQKRRRDAGGTKINTVQQRRLLGVACARCSRVRARRAVPLLKKRHLHWSVRGAQVRPLAVRKATAKRTPSW
jgi:hypothetical protein